MFRLRGYKKYFLCFLIILFLFLFKFEKKGLILNKKISLNDEVFNGVNVFNVISHQPLLEPNESSDKHNDVGF